MGMGKEGGTSFLRELVDVPEKAAIVTGSGLIAYSIFVPGLLPLGLALAGGGYLGLQITENISPRSRN